MNDFEYITEYKGYAIYQDMESGYFYTSDENDHVISCEATEELLRMDIDQLVGRKQI